MDGVDEGISMIKFVFERRWEYEAYAYCLIGFNCRRWNRRWRIAVVLFNYIIGIENTS